MRKLFLSLIVLVLLASMSLAVVAQDDDPCDIPAPAEGTTINMIGWTFPILDYYAEELKICNDVDNLTVNVQLLASADAQSEMRLAASSTGDSPYDIIHGSNNFIGEIIDTGWLLPLNDLLAEYGEAYDLADIDASNFDAVTRDGNVYGVPIVVNTQIFMYNKDILAAAGVEAPQTYDDVIAICEADTLEAEFPFAMVVSAGWAWRGEFYNMLLAYDGSILDENNMPVFNSPEGVAALEKMMEVVNACMGEEGILLSTDDVQAGLANGSIAMAHLWASRAAAMDDENFSSVVGSIEFAPALYPTSETPKRGGMAWGDYLAIPATSSVDPALTFQVIMEAADLASQTGAVEFGLVPRNAVGDLAPRYSAASLQTIAEGGPGINNPAVGLVNAAVEQFIPMVATGSMTAQEALDAAAARYEEEARAQGFIE